MTDHKTVVTYKHRPFVSFILEKIAYLFGFQYQEQVIELNHGQHEISVATDGTPLQVWFCFEDIDQNLPVCLGNVDKIGLQIVENGFVLYADVASTCRKIRWFASFM